MAHPFQLFCRFKEIFRNSGHHDLNCGRISPHDCINDGTTNPVFSPGKFPKPGEFPEDLECFKSDFIGEQAAVRHCGIKKEDYRKFQQGMESERKVFSKSPDNTSIKGEFRSVPGHSQGVII